MVVVNGMKTVPVLKTGGSNPPVSSAASGEPNETGAWGGTYDGSLNYLCGEVKKTSTPVPVANYRCGFDFVKDNGNTIVKKVKEWIPVDKPEAYGSCNGLHITKFSL